MGLDMAIYKTKKLMVSLLLTITKLMKLLITTLKKNWLKLMVGNLTSLYQKIGVFPKL